MMLTVVALAKLFLIFVFTGGCSSGPVPVEETTSTSELTVTIETSNQEHHEANLSEVNLTPVIISEKPMEASTIQVITVTPSNYDLTTDSPDCPPISGNLDSLTHDQLIGRLTHVCRYDKAVKPDTDGPLEVHVQIDVRHIEAVEQLQFKTHMMIQYRFMDKRLSFEDISPRRQVIVGQDALRGQIWIPHVVLKNENEAQVMGIDGKDVLVAITPQGEVIYSYRLTAVIYCWMDLKKFPFDTQQCDMVFRSWVYNASYLLLRWEEEEPVRVAHQLHLTEYTLKSSSSHHALMPATFAQKNIAGTYSCIVFKFLIDREVGYYIMDYFIPSIMLVCISWVNFWLHADASAPRITIGTSTMLTFITLSSGQAKNLPKVSYIKASEIWFLGITVFLFASMAEFAFVNVIWRRKKRVALKKKNSKYILKSTLTPSLARRELQKSVQKSHSCSSLEVNSKSDNEYNNYLTVHSFHNIPEIITEYSEDLSSTNGNSEKTIAPQNNNNNSNNNNININSVTTMTPQEIAIWIDKKSRIVFPCAFVVFNILYWSFVYGL